MRSTLFSFAALALVCSPGATQTTIEVSGGGDAIAVAVASAKPGDVLLVRAGSYAGFTVDKGIAILCDPGVQTFAVTHFQSASVFVRDLPAGELFRLRGLTIGRDFYFPGLNVEDAVGAVYVEDLVTPRVSVKSSAHVSLNGCDVQGDQAAALDIEDSSVCVANSRVATVSFLYATPGMSAARSRVSLRGSEIRGSDGSMPLSVAGEAVLATDSELVFGAGTAGATMLLVAGDPSLPAVLATNGSVRLDPSVQFVGAAAVAGSATIDVRPQPSIDTRGAAAGEVWTVTAHSEVGSTTTTFLGVPLTPLPTPFGDLWVFPWAGLQLDSGVVGPSGTRTFTFTLPPMPAAIPVMVQPIAILTSGDLILGAPAGAILN
ncbi:MAG: hypothetical protein AAF628_09795 [Planctomycetota bacterium]